MSFLNRLFGGPGAAGHQLVQPAEYKARYMDDAMPHTLVDVRTPEEFSGGYIPGAININLQELQQKMSKHPQGQAGDRLLSQRQPQRVCRQHLKQAGYTDVYDLGGIIDWARQGLPITR
jgi:phage shock protein E